MILARCLVVLLVGCIARCLNQVDFNRLVLFPSGNNIRWTDPYQKEHCQRLGMYQPANIIPTRMQMYKEYAFIVTPRFRHGVPFTLGRIDMNDESPFNPCLEPFPSWKANYETNQEALQNVVDLYLDVEDSLWVLDIGVMFTYQRPTIVQGPRIFNLCPETGKVLGKIDLRPLVSDESKLQFLSGELTEDGKRFLYVSDAGGCSIVVWDVRVQRGYRALLPPAVYTQGGKKDVLYMALLGPTLYLTYLSARAVFQVETALLRRGASTGPVTVTGIKPSPMVFLGTDGSSTLFLRPRGGGAIYAWRSDGDFSPENIVLVQEEEDCRRATHVTPGYKSLVWALRSNFHDFIHGRVGCLGVSAILAPLVRTWDT